MPDITSAQVAEWLDSLPDTRATPVLVTIGRTTYVGAHYVQNREPIAPYCQPARASDMKPYTARGYYLLGELPASYKRLKRTAYRVNAGRYYVAAYWQDDVVTKHHPFGRMFMLFPDTLGVTDEHEERAMEVRW
jgi:hypothetical protein